MGFYVLGICTINFLSINFGNTRIKNMAGSNVFRLCILVILMILPRVSGNGRMLMPPQRSSLWRRPEFYRNSLVYKNYDDHTLDCGGYWVI